MATAKKPSATARKAPATKVPSVSPVRGNSADWYLGTLSGWQGAVARDVTAVFAKAAPKATSGVKWAQLVWELGGPFAFMKANKAHLTLGFWRGAELLDPGGLLEGDGDRMRHLKLREGQALPEKAITAFVKQAVALNRANGDPTKR